MSGGIRLLPLAAFCAIGCMALGQTPAAPVQSARQAVIEIITGGQDGFKKHLTVEVLQKVNNGTDSSTAANPFAFVETMKADGVDFQSFPAGPLLFSVDNPKQHKKIEVHIESEEIRGSSDQMDLAFVSFENGKEQSVPMDFHVVLGLKLEESVWRLNTISATVKLPVGDPRFFDSNFWASPQSAGTDEQTGINSAESIASNMLGVNTGSQKNVKQKIPIVRAVRLIGLAENIYQQRHPQSGFTCKLADLINIGKGVGIGDTDSSYSFIEPELASGQYNGYRFTLLGCQGAPVNSYHVTAEPLSGSGRAYCSDATHALRASEDGRGATCVIAGKPTIN